MKCIERLAALNEYLDGETQTALCLALQTHLIDCRPCRVVIDNLRQTITFTGQAKPCRCRRACTRDSARSCASGGPPSFLLPEAFAESTARLESEA